MIPTYNVIYEWAGDYMCSGCIVRAMLEHEPWVEWTATYDNNEYSSTQVALSVMARHFKLRTSEQRRDAGFPLVVAATDETIFCAICLNLLHQAP